VPDDDTQDTEKRIREGVNQAVLDSLAPKEINYDYVAVREAIGELGDDLPLVTVDLRPDCDADRKKSLTNAIAVILQAEPILSSCRIVPGSRCDRRHLRVRISLAISLNSPTFWSSINKRLPIQMMPTWPVLAGSESS